MATSGRSAHPTSEGLLFAASSHRLRVRAQRLQSRQILLLSSYWTQHKQHACYIPISDKLNFMSARLQDVWRHDLETGTWEELVPADPATALPARSVFGAAAIGKSLVSSPSAGQSTCCCSVGLRRAHVTLQPADYAPQRQCCRTG